MASVEEETNIAEKQESAKEQPREPSGEAEGGLEIPAPQGKSPDWLKIILFILLGILVLGSAVYGGYWYATTSQTTTRKPQFEKPETTPSPTPAQPSPAEDETAGWEVYQSESYGFELSYPEAWSINKNSQSFKEGKDLLQIWIWGEAQRKGTELYDGASFTIGKPVKTEINLEKWVESYYPEEAVDGEPYTFSQERVGNLEFKTVSGCGLMCFTDYITKKNNQIYRLKIVSSGPKKEQYEETAEKIFSTFRFTD